MVLHLDSRLRGALVEDVPEVDRWRVEGDSRHREAAEDVELNWEDLVGTSYSYWDSHGEFFKLVLRRILVILAHKVSITSCKNRSVWPKLKPDLKRTHALDVA